MLLGKSLVLTAFMASLTLSTPVVLGLNFSSPLVSVDSTKAMNHTEVNYLVAISKHFPWLWFTKHHRINKVEVPMKINFRQSGGYGGLRMSCDLDTNLLAPEEAAQLESLVKTSGILQAQSALSENAADLINYEITIETTEGKHQVKFDDLTLPETVLPLLDYLQSHAKRIR